MGRSQSLILIATSLSLLLSHSITIATQHPLILTHRTFTLDSSIHIPHNQQTVTTTSYRLLHSSAQSHQYAIKTRKQTVHRWRIVPDPLIATSSSSHTFHPSLFDQTLHPNTAQFQAYDHIRLYSLLSSRSPTPSSHNTTTCPLSPHLARILSSGPPPYSLQWYTTTVDAPDVTDMATLATLGKMTANAYEDPANAGKGSSWWDVGGRWNLSDSFGWDEDGIRGHVFATEDNSTIVISVKGTSAGLVGGGGRTGKNDKYNDNLFFSCCCARVDFTWSPVCDCYRSPWHCDEPCLEDALIEKSVYYPLSTNLYKNISSMYPSSQIWLTGHSLGGSLSSLLGVTFSTPTVTFEAVGDLLPVRRLHLPSPDRPPSSSSSSPHTYAESPVTHVFHTADPIPMGTCTGYTSACAIAGFALESRCHAGKKIVFDTVEELGWRVDIRTHSIARIIQDVLVDDWDKKGLAARKRRARKKAEVDNNKERGKWEMWKWPWQPGGGGDDDDDGGDGEQPGGGDGGNGDGDGGGGGDGGDQPEKSKPPEAVPDDGCVDCFRWKFTNGDDDGGGDGGGDGHDGGGEGHDGVLL